MQLLLIAAMLSHHLGPLLLGVLVSSFLTVLLLYNLPALLFFRIQY